MTSPNPLEAMQERAVNEFLTKGYTASSVTTADGRTVKLLMHAEIARALELVLADGGTGIGSEIAAAIARANPQ